ncbi:MAG: glycerol-3-phosphate acyltransferase [Chloroflexi bacterium]|nr:glycerol-3-phosphate acyltransferase [Chloroflexota bacterium]
MEILQIGSLATSIAVGYVLGSAPVAYLVARFRGVDIFEVGTRNPGAANVFRVVSRSLGTLVLVLDALKGLLAVVMANIFGVIPEATAVAGAAALVGHWHPVFMRFRGGAGLATVVGAGIGLAPVQGLIAVLLALVTLLIIRNTGYAAAVGYVGFVSLSPFLETTWAATLGATSLAALVGLRSMAVNILQHHRDKE